MLIEPWYLATILIAAFFVSAMLHSSVGLGGGSSYTAWMVILAVPSLTIPSIALSHRTQEELKQADLLIAMDLSDFSIADNTDRYEELYAIGQDTAAKQLAKMGWYRKTNVLLYLWRIVCLITPFKLPQIFDCCRKKS